MRNTRLAEPWHPFQGSTGAPGTGVEEVQRPTLVLTHLARKELVRVSSRQSKGREELVLLTNEMAIYGIATGQGHITAHAIRDKLPAEDLKRFDSHLGRGTVICDVPGERR